MTIKNSELLEMAYEIFKTRLEQLKKWDLNKEENETIALESVALVLWCEQYEGKNK